eukprot:131362-Prymnesium_polylepis.1
MGRARGGRRPDCHAAAQGRRRAHRARGRGRRRHAPPRAAAPAARAARGAQPRGAEPAVRAGARGLHVHTEDQLGRPVARRATSHRHRPRRALQVAARAAREPAARRAGRSAAGGHAEGGASGGHAEGGAAGGHAEGTGEAAGVGLQRAGRSTARSAPRGARVPA